MAKEKQKPDPLGHSIALVETDEANLKAQILARLPKAGPELVKVLKRDFGASEVDVKHLLLAIVKEGLAIVDGAGEDAVYRRPVNGHGADDPPRHIHASDHVIDIVRNNGPVQARWVVDLVVVARPKLGRNTVEGFIDELIRDGYLRSDADGMLSLPGPRAEQIPPEVRDASGPQPEATVEGPALAAGEVDESKASGGELGQGEPPSPAAAALAHVAEAGEEGTTKPKLVQHLKKQEGLELDAANRIVLDLLDQKRLMVGDDKRLRVGPPASAVPSSAPETAAAPACLGPVDLGRWLEGKGLGAEHARELLELVASGQLTLDSKALRIEEPVPVADVIAAAEAATKPKVSLEPFEGWVRLAEKEDEAKELEATLAAKKRTYNHQVKEAQKQAKAEVDEEWGDTISVLEEELAETQGQIQATHDRWVKTSRNVFAATKIGEAKEAVKAGGKKAKAKAAKPAEAPAQSEAAAPADGPLTVNPPPHTPENPTPLAVEDLPLPFPEAAESAPPPQRGPAPVMSADDIERAAQGLADQADEEGYCSTAVADAWFEAIIEKGEAADVAGATALLALLDAQIEGGKVEPPPGYVAPTDEPKGLEELPAVQSKPHRRTDDVRAWLRSTVGDVNFKGALERSTVEDCRAVLGEVRGKPGNKLRVKVLEARLRKLEKAEKRGGERTKKGELVHA